MPFRKYDYASLEDEFIRGSMSVRELARIHGIPQARVSSLHDQARKRDANGRNWYDKRVSVAQRVGDRELEATVDVEARRRIRQLQVKDHAIEVIDKYLTAAERDLEATHRVTRKGKEVVEPLIRVNPRDLSTLLDRLNPLFASLPPEGSSFGASASFSITSTEPRAGVAALAGLASLARERSRGAEPRTVGGSPLPDAPDPRPDQ